MKHRDVKHTIPSIGHVQRVAVDVRTVTDRVRAIEQRLAYNVPIVSALPSSGIDGQIIRFQSAAMATLGIVWEFRYRSGLTYPWEFVGGGSWFVQIITAETTASTTYADLATVGPSITMPLKGEYEVSWGASVDFTAITTNRVARVGLSNAGGTPADADSIRSGHPNIASLTQSHQKADTVAIAAAGDVLKMQYKAASAGTDTARYASRFMAVTPLHVSL